MAVQITPRIAWAAVGLLCWAALTAPVAAQKRSQLSFAVIGDLAYVAAREPQLDAVLADINKSPLGFVVHLGDLGGSRAGSCTDELRQMRLRQFQASTHPLIFTPGDNDWTDCHADQGTPGGDPLERLETLRKVFFPGERSLGKRTLPLVRQSREPAFASYRENVRWEMSGVTFLTIHVVGSNNGRGRTPQSDAEYTERTAANIAWLAAGFAYAKARASIGVVILQHANMFPGLEPFPDEAKGKDNGFDATRAALAKEAADFGNPVLLVHGDTHFFRVDKPFMRRRGSDPAIENVTRVEGFGDPFHHWVQIDVEPKNPSVFAIRERIVPANVNKGR